jgi:hypothetical protein
LVFGITILVILAVAVLAGILWLTGMRTQMMKESALMLEAEQSLAQTIKRCIHDCSGILEQAEEQTADVASQLKTVHRGLEQAKENEGTDAYIAHISSSREQLSVLLKSIDGHRDFPPGLLADIKDHLQQLDQAIAYYKGTKLHFERITKRFPYKWLAGRIK